MNNLPVRTMTIFVALGACAQTSVAEATDTPVAASTVRLETAPIQEGSEDQNGNFDKTDADGDGVISRDEVLTLIGDQNPDAPPHAFGLLADAYFAKFDMDADGEVSEVEYELTQRREGGQNCANCE